MRARTVAALAATVLVVGVTPAAAAPGATYTIGPVADISASCSGQNAEVEQAADAQRGYVYEI